MARPGQMVLACVLGLGLTGCGDESDDGSGNDRKGGNGGQLDDGMSWRAPLLLEDSNTSSAPHIAVDGDGDYVAVWVQDTGSDDAIFARRFADGSWAAAERASPAGLTMANDAVIGLGVGGNGFVLFNAVEGFQLKYFALAFQPGTGWAASATELGHRSILDNMIGIADDGETVATGTAGLDAWAVTHDGGWGASATPNAGGMVNEPRFDLNAAGIGILVWEQGDEIYAAPYDGTWAAARVISSGSDVNDPDVAVAANGAAMAVWRQGDGPRYAYACRYSGGSWGNPEIISTEGRAAGATPRVEVDGSGRYIAVWEENVGMSDTIFVNRYAGSWGTAVQIGTLAESAEDPKIAMSANGKAVVVWEQEGDSYDVFSARYLPDPGGWMPAEAVEEGPGDSRYPFVAIDDAGEAMAVWSFDDGERRAKAARLR